MCKKETDEKIVSLSVEREREAERGTERNIITLGFGHTINDSK